jgi:hypothetical protein
VLEGLRRIDEGIMPDASQAFATEEEIDEATIEYLNCIESAKEDAATAARGASKDSDAADNSFPLPMSQTLEATSASGSKRKFVVAGVAAALVLACVVVAVPLSKRFSRSSASSTPAPAAAPSTTDTANAQGDNNASATPAASTDPNATAATTDAASEAAALAARREREARLERLRKLEAKKDAAAQASTDANATDAAAPKPAPVGPKTVRVSVSYDEAGRVTQTSVVGSSPGAEAYASTAVRVARGRRFPAGKAGSAVVTIPIN